MSDAGHPPAEMSLEDYKQRVLDLERRTLELLERLEKVADRLEPLGPRIVDTLLELAARRGTITMPSPRMPDRDSADTRGEGDTAAPRLGADPMLNVGASADAGIGGGDESSSSRSSHDDGARVRVIGAPIGAVITIGGVVRVVDTVDAVTVDALAGDAVEVLIEGRGFKPQRETMRLEEGRTRTVRAALELAEPRAPKKNRTVPAPTLPRRASPGNRAR